MKELILNSSEAVDASFFADAKQLTRLSLTWFFDKDAIEYLSNDYSQLEALALDTCPTPSFASSYENAINNFLKRHPNLTEFAVRGSVYDLSSIGEYCPSLRKLIIWGMTHESIAAIAQSDQLTTLKLLDEVDDQMLKKLLMTSKSSQSLEDLVIVFDTDAAVNVFSSALARFTNLKILSLQFKDDSITDIILAELHSLRNLRALSLRGFLLLTIDGLVGLVRHLPHLEQLSIFNYYSDEFLELKQSSYQRICDIYQGRNQKLVFYNFDITDDELKDEEREEPLAETGALELVRFITLKLNSSTTLENCSVVKI